MPTRARQGRRLGALLAKAGLFAALSLASVGAGAMIARNLPERAPAPLPELAVARDPVPARPFDLMPRLQAEMRDALLRPEAGIAAPFRGVARVAPDRLCALLAEAGLPMGALARDAFTVDGQSCLSELVSVGADGRLSAVFDEASETTLFAMVRADGEGRLESVRLKLNALSRETTRAGAERIADLVDAVYDAIGRDLPGATLASVARLQPVIHELAGVRLQLAPEMLDARRINIVIDVPTTSGILATRRFDPLYFLGGLALSSASE